MAVEKFPVGLFIDAACLDPSKAVEMLRQNPELFQGRWVHDETPLHFLAIEGKAEQVRRLAGWGFDPNVVNEFGHTPLIEVAMMGRNDVARVLLEVGADPNATSPTLDNALHLATQGGNLVLVELLLSAGADATYVTETGTTIFDAIDTMLGLSMAPDGQAEMERLLARYGVHRPKD